MPISVKKNKLLRKFFFLGLFLLLCSVLVLFPVFQNYILDLAESLLHRTLTRTAWYERFFLWGIESIISAVFFELSLLFYSFRNPENIKINTKPAIYLIVALESIAMIISAVICKDLVVDEAFSLALVRHNFSEVARFTALDVHPPLYYFILKIFLDVFNGSVIVAKLVSVIPCIFLLFIVAKFLSKEFSVYSAIFFEIIFFASSMLTKYSSVIRMYSWAFFFTAMCVICSFYIIKYNRLKSYLLYIFFAECAAYTHYFAAVSVLINFLLTSCIIIYKSKASFKKILISAFLGIVLYLPWLKEILSQINTVSNDYWIQPIGTKEIISFIQTLFSLTLPESSEPAFSLVNLIIMFFVFFASVKIILKIAGSKDENEKFRLFYILSLVTTSFLFVISGILLSVAIRPVFISRYIIVVIPILLLFVATSAEMFSPDELKSSVLIFIFSASIVCGIDIFKYKIEHRNSFKHFEENILEVLDEDVKFEMTPSVAYYFHQILTYYFPKNNHIPTDEYIANFFDEIYSKDKKQNHTEKKVCYVYAISDETPSFVQNLNFIEAKTNYSYKSLKFYFPDEARIK